MYNRKLTKAVKVGNIGIGGHYPITVQSMTNTQTADVAATLAQINQLVDAGCEIVRVAVNTTAAAAGFAEIRRKMPDVPLVADIHFDHQLALAAIEAGADKIRINPGNIGENWKVKAVADMAKKRGIPIRIGVNGGSLEADLLEKYGVSAQAMVESALRNVRLLNDHDFDDIVISIKASNVPMSLEAHKILSKSVDYPLHIGITEAGTLFSGTIKSTAGLAAMLTCGIGDTVRISLTADPVEEVRAARELLKALKLRHFGPEIISCPTCGRCEINLVPIAEEIERLVAHIKAPIKIAIMGCVVNGPGEAKECDIGIAGGRGVGILFKKGKIVRKVSENEIIPALINEINDLVNNAEKTHEYQRKETI